MKKYLVLIMTVLLVLTAVSCRGHEGPGEEGIFFVIYPLKKISENNENFA